MEHVFIVIDTQPHGVPGHSIVGAFRSYEDAQAAAREIGVAQCLVQRTTLK